MRIQLAPYSANWPAQYKKNAEKLRRVLREGARRIEHIGSTAVPGLASKPIIDILLEVDDTSSATLEQRLAGMEFLLVVDEPGHRMFRSAVHDVHVHVWRNGDPEIERHLQFRDRLRNSPDDRQFYQREKFRLAAMDWPTQNDYAQAKSPAVAEILGHTRESSKR